MLPAQAPDLVVDLPCLHRAAARAVDAQDHAYRVALEGRQQRVVDALGGIRTTLLDRAANLDHGRVRADDAEARAERAQHREPAHDEQQQVGQPEEDRPAPRPATLDEAFRGELLEQLPRPAFVDRTRRLRMFVPSHFRTPGFKKTVIVPSGTRPYISADPGKEEIRQRARAVDHAERGARGELGPGMRAVGYPDRGGARRDRHVEVVRGVADHHRIPRIHAEFLADVAQHPGIGLGRALVRRARGDEEAGPAGLLERPVQAGARLAGGHRHPGVAGREPLEQADDTFEGDERGVAREVVQPIALQVLRHALARQLGHRVRECLEHAEPDDMRSALGRRHRQPEVGGRLADRVDDRTGRVHQGAVPVEDDEAELAVRGHQAGVPPETAGGGTRASNSGGTGATSRRVVPVAGWRSVIAAAWRYMRPWPARASARFRAKSAYFGSPATGYPRWARCTRIWWVRPVSMRQATRVNSPISRLARERPRTRVSAACPCAGSTATRRSPSAVR